MNKFSLNEIAIINLSAGDINSQFNGMSCEITEINVVNMKNEPRDYSIRITGHISTGNKGEWCINEPYLKKRPKDDEASWDKIEEKLGWNPTKDRVVQ